MDNKWLPVIITAIVSFLGAVFLCCAPDSTPASMEPSGIDGIEVSCHIVTTNQYDSTIDIVLKNDSSETLTALGAVLSIGNTYEFSFYVDASHPLLPGNTTSSIMTIPAKELSENTPYLLTITRTLSNNTTFSNTLQIQFSEYNNQTDSVSFDKISACAVANNGLCLGVSVNATRIHPGDRLKITVNEKNIMAATNNVTISDNWPLEELTEGPCGTINYPFWISIYRGYHDMTNVTSVAPVPLYRPDEKQMCPELLGGIVSYEFSPSSNTVIIYQGNSNDPDTAHRAGILPMPLEFVSGTALWSTGTKTLTPGIFTIAAGDEWGTITVLHFTVLK